FVVGTSVGCLYAAGVRHAYVYSSKAHSANKVTRYAVGNPNDFGVVVVIGMVMAFHLLTTTASRRMKLAYSAFLALGVLAVFLSASRSSLIVLVVAGLVAILDRRVFTAGRFAGLLLVAAIASVGIVKVVTDQQLTRITSIESGSQTGFNNRTTLWNASFDTFSHHPLTGGGAAAFREQAAEVTGKKLPAHNSFLGVLADLGIVG